MTDTPTPQMTPEQRAATVYALVNLHNIDPDNLAAQLEADGVTIATLTTERDAAQAEIARLTAALDAERDRCMRIVSAARNGDIDQDMRTLLHFMDCGDQMVFDADKHKYIPDHVAKDRALIAAITKGAAI